MLLCGYWQRRSIYLWLYGPAGFHTSDFARRLRVVSLNTRKFSRNYAPAQAQTHAFINRRSGNRKSCNFQFNLARHEYSDVNDAILNRNRYPSGSERNFTRRETLSIRDLSLHRIKRHDTVVYGGKERSWPFSSAMNSTRINLEELRFETETICPGMAVKSE